jgi:DNA-binding NarL/FixJ family response regulator
MSSTVSAKISLLFIEDNRLLREGLTAMVNKEPDLEVVGALGSRDSFLERIQATAPVITLVDSTLSGRSSLDVVETIRKRFPRVKLIVMDLFPSQADVLEFVTAGVTGFLLKDATCEEFLKTVRAVASGMSVLPPTLTGSLFSEIVDRGLRRQRLEIVSGARLTKREREIVELIAAGSTNKEIAQHLNLATFTVKSHVHNILEKLALRSRLQVASYYTRTQNVIAYPYD